MEKMLFCLMKLIFHFLLLYLSRGFSSITTRKQWTGPKTNEGKIMSESQWLCQVSLFFYFVYFSLPCSVCETSSSIKLFVEKLFTWSFLSRLSPFILNLLGKATMKAFTKGEEMSRSSCSFSGIYWFCSITHEQTEFYRHFVNLLQFLFRSNPLWVSKGMLLGRKG